MRILSIIQNVIIYSTPLLFISLGVMVNEVAGIVNMGAEGVMLIGCLTAVAGTALSGSIWIGTLLAVVLCVIFNVLYGFLAIEFNVSQIVLGVAWNLVGAGLTITLNRTVFPGLTSQDTYPKIFGFGLPVYIGVLCCLILWIVLHKTNFGIRLRSVGENPVVVESVGANVKKLRYDSCIIGGVLIGLGSAYFSTGILNQFTEGMTDGRGFIALAAVTFGKYGPWGTLGGVLIFGAGETLSYRLQASGSSIPYEFALMLPYLLTIVMLVIFSRNAKDPSALGKPYWKNR